MAQSAEMTKFYNAYNNWVEAGAPESGTFEPRSGLCTSLRHWCHHFGLVHSRAGLLTELEMQFAIAGLDTNYPFGTEDEYNDRQDNNTQHLCPVRMAWVKAHLTA